MERIGHCDPAIVQPTLGPVDPWGYRNKIDFPFGIFCRNP